MEEKVPCIKQAIVHIFTILVNINGDVEAVKSCDQLSFKDTDFSQRSTSVTIRSEVAIDDVVGRTSEQRNCFVDRKRRASACNIPENIHGA